MSISIKHVSELTPAPLHCQYASQSEPQEAYIMLDCREGTLFAEYSDVIGINVPDSVFNGWAFQWNISPSMSGWAINALLDEIAPLAGQIVSGYSEQDGQSCFNADAHNCINAIYHKVEKYNEDMDNMDCVFSVDDIIDFIGPEFFKLNPVEGIEDKNKYQRLAYEAMDIVESECPYNKKKFDFEPDELANALQAAYKREQEVMTAKQNF